MLFDSDLTDALRRIRLAYQLLAEVFGPRRAPHPDDWVAVDDPSLARFERVLREAIARDELDAYPLDAKGSLVAVRRGDLDAWIESRRGKPRAPRIRAVDQAEAELEHAPGEAALLDQLGLELVRGRRAGGR